MLNSTGRLLPSLLLGLVLLASLSCRKSLPEPEAVPLPSEVKAYTLFQPGTYWVYQDSASHQLDSVWVVSTEQSVLRLGQQGSELPSLKHEDFRMQTRSSRGGSDQVYSVHRVCGMGVAEDATAVGGACWFIQRGAYLPNSTADEGGTDLFPYRIEREKALFYNLPFAILYPYWHARPVLIGGHSYEDVMELKLTSDASEAGWASHYYWAPSKGIVRHRIKRAGSWETWTLSRSHILQ